MHLAGHCDNVGSHKSTIKCFSTPVGVSSTNGKSCTFPTALNPELYLPKQVKTALGNAGIGEGWDGFSGWGKAEHRANKAQEQAGSMEETSAVTYSLS